MQYDLAWAAASSWKEATVVFKSAPPARCQRCQLHIGFHQRTKCNRRRRPKPDPVCYARLCMITAASEAQEPALCFQHTSGIQVHGALCTNVPPTSGCSHTITPSWLAGPSLQLASRRLALVSALAHTLVLIELGWGTMVGASHQTCWGGPGS